MLFGLSAALTKPTLDYLHESVGTMLSHWEPYALAIAGILGFVLQQVSLATGRLAPSVATVSVANPIVSVLLGALLLDERLERPAWHVVARLRRPRHRAGGRRRHLARAGGEEGRGDRPRIGRAVGRRAPEFGEAGDRDRAGEPRSRSPWGELRQAGSATASSGAASEKLAPSVDTSWIVCRMRPAIWYGSPIEFGRRSSR